MGTQDLDAALQTANSWARTVASVRDPAIQIGWLRERIARAGAGRAADILTVVLARAEQREKPFEVLLLRASLALSAPEIEAEKHAIARIAAARGQLGLARFLGHVDDADARAPEPDESQQDDEADPPPNAALARAMMERGRPISLGERKTLARRRDRNLLARVLRDPHPDVIRILLDNPALTEVDVVRLCARRPAPPEVLGQVFRHPRWILRYGVRRALVLNPHTPDVISLQLLPHLTPADLALVARSADLSARVRDACGLPAQRSLH